MNTQHAKRLMLDVIGIVLAWNDRLITDKQAMNKVVGSLLHDKNNQNGVVPRTKTSKKSAGLLAIATGFAIISFVFVVSFDFFPSDETKLIAENEEIGFEQLREMPSEAVEKIQNYTTNEEFSNKINSGEG